MGKETNHWHRVVLSRDQIMAGEHRRLRQLAWRTYAARERAAGIALFSTSITEVLRPSPRQDPSLTLYFSPLASRYMTGLLREFHGERCAKPAEGTVTLVLGDPADLWNVLW